MTDENPLAGWHVSKTVNLGHLVTTGAMILAAIWYLAGQDTRLSRAELNIEHLQMSRANESARIEKKFDELKQDLRIISAKIDQLNRDERN